ncbi:MAG: hypothetical protein KKE86_17405 [Planctomycetes bacterium]|nr:hypothetical protein [Planctomycetota bacterium]
MPEIPIVELRWSDEVDIKIARRGLSRLDVYEAIVLDPNHEAYWVEDEEHGRRLYARGVSESNPKEVLAYLDPLNEFDGIWSVRTAWRLD